MNEKSWASLAPLLDHRRYVESIIAGIQIKAHREFRACVTMNRDESTFEIPDYILSRLQPTLPLSMPNYQDEMAILQYHLPFAENDLLEMTVDFLQKSHQLDLDFSPRERHSHSPIRFKAIEPGQRPPDCQRCGLEGSDCESSG